MGCFLEIPQSSIPTHPLLGFVYSSLQVASSLNVFNSQSFRGVHTGGHLILFDTGCMRAESLWDPPSL